MDSLQIMRSAKEALLSKKGADIIVFDVRQSSPVTDYYVVVSGTSAPQLKALASAVSTSFKHLGNAVRTSGAPDDGWIVVDLFDVVIHIFQKEVREYYAIEELWADNPRVD